MAKILLVEDNEMNHDMLSRRLTRRGFQVVIAVDGVQGVALALAESPDLILMDMSLPVMDGWEVCQQLRKHSEVPIIVLSAKGDELAKLQGFRLGVDDYVTKPFSFAEMAARVGAVLSRSIGKLALSRSVTSGDLVIDFDQRRVTVLRVRHA